MIWSDKSNSFALDFCAHFLQVGAGAIWTVGQGRRRSPSVNLEKSCPGARYRKRWVLSRVGTLSLPFAADSYPERRDSLAFPWGHPSASSAAAVCPWDVQGPFYGHISNNQRKKLFFNTFDLPRTRRAMHLRCSHSLTPNGRGCCGAAPLALRAEPTVLPTARRSTPNWRIGPGPARGHMGPAGGFRGGSGAPDRGPLREGALGHSRPAQPAVGPSGVLVGHPFRPCPVRISFAVGGAEDPAPGGLWWSQRPTRAHGAVHVGY